MGMRDILPPDLLQEMLDNGVKFDENGEIIEDEDLLNSEEDEDDDQETDSEDTSEGDADEDSDEDDSEDDQEETPVKKSSNAKKVDLKKELSDDEDEEEEVTPRFKLTPKANEADSSSVEVMSLRRELEELKALLKAPKQEQAPANADEGLETLRQEAAQFKKMRMQEFARNVENSVNGMFPDTTFKEIIASHEWEQYQNSRVMGSRVGDLYITTVKSGETSDVVSFFSDFVERFLPSLSQVKPIAASMKKVAKSKDVKPDLKDLAIPDKAKAAVSKPKRTGFDFLESDYQKTLERAERGQISLEDFDKFEQKFLKAEREGRVKKD